MIGSASDCPAAQSSAGISNSSSAQASEAKARSGSFQVRASPSTAS